MKYNKLLAIGLAAFMIFSSSVYAQENRDEAQELAEGVKIGVLSFNPDDAETKSYRQYLEGYLSEAFDAEFYYSEAVNTVEEEQAFIEQLHEMGVHGVIGNLSEETMSLCEEYGIYYVFGSATVSDAVFDRIKNNEHFLGTISASLDAEKEAAEEMVNYFVEDDAKASHGFIICTGGDNELHRTRSAAMLKKLADLYQAELESTAEELVAVTEIQALELADGVKLTLIPGYPGITPLAENVEKTACEGGFDTVLSVMSVNPIMEAIRLAEETAQTDIRVGSIDSFTEEAAELFQTEDAFGNAEIDYLTGTYGAMIAPSFVAVCNAYFGNVDSVRDEDEAFRLYRHYWTAKGAEEFEDLYEQSISLYDNAYSAVDIMKVLKAYTPEMTFEDFREFTER